MMVSFLCGYHTHTYAALFIVINFMEGSPLEKFTWYVFFWIVHFHWTKCKHFDFFLFDLLLSSMTLLFSVSGLLFEHARMTPLVKNTYIRLPKHI